jgi:hypothetical protein
VVYVIHHNKTTKAKKEPPLLAQGRIFIGNTEDGINQTFDLHIVSSSGSYRKRNTRSMPAVIFIPIFVRCRTYT